VTCLLTVQGTDKLTRGLEVAVKFCSSRQAFFEKDLRETVRKLVSHDSCVEEGFRHMHSGITASRESRNQSRSVQPDDLLLKR
jgi:hypothetical protein